MKQINSNIRKTLTKLLDKVIMTVFVTHLLTLAGLLNISSILEEILTLTCRQAIAHCYVLGGSKTFEGF